MDEVLERALTRKPEPIEWDETAAKLEPAPAAEAAAEEETPGLTAH
jgi:ATP-dependent Lon protease